MKQFSVPAALVTILLLSACVPIATPIPASVETQAPLPPPAVTQPAADVKLDGAGKYATLFGRAGGEEYQQFCSLVRVKELPDSTDVDVTTDVPTLLLGGSLDVATPTFRSQEVAANLPNATLVVFPGRTHVQIGAANLCAAEVMTKFVLDPTAALDTSCLSEAPGLGFVLPDGTNSLD